MRIIRSALVVASFIAPLIAPEAQSVLLPAQSSPALSVTTVRVGSEATLRTDGGQWRIDADRMEFTSVAGDVARAGTVILESLDAAQEVRLRITPAGATQAITLVATRFTLTRKGASQEWQVRGENQRVP